MIENNYSVIAREVMNREQNNNNIGTWVANANNAQEKNLNFTLRLINKKISKKLMHDNPSLICCLKYLC